jgi:undecaprenyl diphosphate synthase
LLYDSEYTEYYFTPKKWPEFDEKEFDKAIDFFNSSKRNFGK